MLNSINFLSSDFDSFSAKEAIARYDQGTPAGVERQGRQVIPFRFTSETHLHPADRIGRPHISKLDY